MKKVNRTITITVGKMTTFLVMGDEEVVYDFDPGLCFRSGDDVSRVNVSMDSKLASKAVPLIRSAAASANGVVCVIEDNSVEVGIRVGVVVVPVGTV